MSQLFKSYSEEEIIKIIQTGGKQENKVIAFVMKINESPIYSYVLKNNGNGDAASIILVEGVSELIMNIRANKFKGNSSINTYLFAICRSLWLQKLRKEKRHVEMTGHKLNSLVDDSSEIVDLDKLKAELNAVLVDIGKGCKKVLKMWSARYSMSEIANNLGYKNAQIAMNKKNRCLTKLKLKVSKNPDLRERLKNYLS